MQEDMRSRKNQYRFTTTKKHRKSMAKILENYGKKTDRQSEGIKREIKTKKQKLKEIYGRKVKYPIENKKAQER